MMLYCVRTLSRLKYSTMYIKLAGKKSSSSLVNDVRRLVSASCTAVQCRDIRAVHCTFVLHSQAHPRLVQRSRHQCMTDEPTCTKLLYMPSSCCRLMVSLTMIALVYIDQVSHGHSVPFHHCIGAAVPPLCPLHQVPARDSLRRSGLLSPLLALPATIPWDHFTSDGSILFWLYHARQHFVPSMYIILVIITAILCRTHSGSVPSSRDGVQRVR